MAPNGSRREIFQLIQTLPTFWATWIWILRISIFEMCLDSKFLDFHVPRIPKSGLSPAGWVLGQRKTGWVKDLQAVGVFLTKIGYAAIPAVAWNLRVRPRLKKIEMNRRGQCSCTQKVSKRHLAGGQILAAIVLKLPLQIFWSYRIICQ